MASKVCCEAGQPIPSTEEPKGSWVNVPSAQPNGLKAYVAGDIHNEHKAAIIVCFDLFGLQDGLPQTRNNADWLAATLGIAVVIPDVFHGEPWPKEKMVIKPEYNVFGWLSEAGKWEGKVEVDWKETHAWLKQQGVERIGSAGYCWGGFTSFQAAADGLSAAAAALHPGFFNKDKELAEKITVPVAIIAAKGDPLESVKEVFDAKSSDLSARSLWRRYDDQIHGFLASRGDRSDPHVLKGVNEVLPLLAQFYRDTLLKVPIEP